MRSLKHLKTLISSAIYSHTTRSACAVTDLQEHEGEN